MKWVASLLLLLWGFTVFGQTNSWVSDASGDWHDINAWGTGVLPGPYQMLLITNPGPKTVRIGSETAQAHADTLRVESLTISGASNAVNRLLIEIGETNTAFSAYKVYVEEGGDLAVLGSRLHGSLYIRGSMSQGEGSYVDVYRANVEGDGVYHLTNGELRTALSYVARGSTWIWTGEDWITSVAVFNHYGGTNSFSMDMTVRGTYNLSGGEVHRRGTLGYLIIGGPWTSEKSTFNQSGGVVNTMVVLGPGGRGVYNLSGGLRTGGPMFLPQTGPLKACEIIQTGGTNEGAITLTPPITLDGEAYPSSYLLSGGVVRSTTVTLSAFATFEQRGGTHFNETIALSQAYVCKRQQPGAPSPRCATVFGEYLLNDGVLVSRRIQSGGRFVQTGGSLTAEQIDGGFSLGGGVLNVTNLVLGGWFQDGAGILNHYGTITLEYGQWNAREGERSLGPLALRSAGNSRSMVWFPTNASVLRFADSSSMGWSREAVLYVAGWNGSFRGGGRHQLRFGNDTRALTQPQIQQIYFLDPAGTRGLYAARILADGEVIPRPSLLAEKRNGQFLLHWPAGFILQTSTNVNGPFEDTPAALSASPLQVTDPVRFFRIKPEEQ